MRWADLKGGVWTAPEEERQKGTGGKLNLPKLALDDSAEIAAAERLLLG